jgi:hypothetical protein
LSPLLCPDEGVCPALPAQRFRVTSNTNAKVETIPIRKFPPPPSHY